MGFHVCSLCVGVLGAALASPGLQAGSGSLEQRLTQHPPGVTSSWAER